MFAERGRAAVLTRLMEASRRDEAERVLRRKEEAVPAEAAGSRLLAGVTDGPTGPRALARVTPPGGGDSSALVFIFHLNNYS